MLLADGCVQDILSRGKTAGIAGGTGLYVDSLIAGRTFAPVPQTGKREALEAQLRQEGGEVMLRKLRAVDPDAAARLHPADEKRIIRALEVWLETGKTITQHNLETQAQPPRYTPVWLGLNFPDRAQLYARIALRAKQMLDEGLAAEVQALLASGVPDNATSMPAIGFKEVVRALRGECSMDEALAEVRPSSRRYAKRQLTWLRRNPAIHWIYWEKDRDFARALQISTEILTASGLG